MFSSHGVFFIAFQSLSVECEAEFRFLLVLLSLQVLRVLECEASYGVLLHVVFVMGYIESDSGSSVSVVDWTNLAVDILDAILSKLVLIPDYIRFGTVCRKWRSIALNQKLNRIESSQQQPPDALDACGQEVKNTVICAVFSRINKVYHHPLPIPFSKRCCGTSYLIAGGLLQKKIFPSH